MSRLKIISSILVILVTIKNSSHFSLRENKFEKLESCLASIGVNPKNLIQRNSGREFTELDWHWNTLNDDVSPMAYLVAHVVSDVQRAVACCRLLNIRPVPRSGGHSYANYGYGDSSSLVIDLSKLYNISTHPVTMSCEIGPGARIGYINSKLWYAGKYMISSGVCPSVGLGGLTLGGGYGYFSRQLGLTSDNLIELEMVDARGKLLVMNKCTNKDLFWAHRGGGGGNFGIVTRLKFRMHLAPKYVAYGFYHYNIVDFAQFYNAWQYLITSPMYNHINAWPSFGKDKIELELYDTNVTRKKNMHFDELLNSLSFPKAITSTIDLLTYPDFLLMTSESHTTDLLTKVSQLETINKDRYVGVSKIKSFYVDKILSEDELNKMVALMINFLQYPYSNIEIETYGGAINRLSRSDTAFVHRGKCLYNIQLYVYSEDSNEEIWKNANRAMNLLYEESKGFLHHRESYQNYIDEDIPDYLERYYGTNLERLIHIKKKIDPQNIFYHPQSIPVNYSSVTLPIL